MKAAAAPESYTQFQEYTARLRGQSVRFVSKPGLANWNEITPAANLLAETIELPETYRLLLLGCGHGAVAAALARELTGGECWLADTNCVALEMAAATLRLNQIANARVVSGISLLPEKANYFDAVAIDLPKGRKLAQRWLAEASQVMRAGGLLFIAGANDHGIQSVFKDAQALIGPGGVMSYKKGNRIVCLIKPATPPPAPEWLSEPGVAPGTWRTITVEALGHTLHLRSLPGIFSWEQLDDGTAMLLEHMQIHPADRVLDLGCGYGVIGLLASLQGAAQVDLVDNNLLAIEAACANLADHNVPNARALVSDGLSAVAGQRYTKIITNPPFHSGQGIDYQITRAFIAQAWQALEPGGQFLLVSNSFIRYDKVMAERFKRVACVAEDSRFQVWRAYR